MTRPTRADVAGRALASSRSRPGASDRSAGLADRATGTRIADDQPLAASWDPRGTEHPVSAAAGRTGAGHPGHGRSAAGCGRRAAGRGDGPSGGTGLLARVVSAYGWRIYALPVLLVVTVLTGFDVATSPGGLSSSDQAASAAFDDTPGSSDADTGREPLIPNPLAGHGFRHAKASAELPRGGAFTPQGAGTWRVVPGAGQPFGAGELFTYTIEIEDGVQVEGGPEGFATTVDLTLNNPKSWIGSGRYQFRRIDDGAAADLRISLTSQMTTRALCGFRIPFEGSCWRGDQHRVVINNARWARGAVAFQGNVVQYQQYVVNHEVGHGLGFSHAPCQDNGQLAPVMMQQTWGVSNDYLATLDTDRVQADGKVCEPNAWPFPTVN